MTTTKNYIANEHRRRSSLWRGNFSHVKLAIGWGKTARFIASGRTKMFAVKMMGLRSRPKHYASRKRSGENKGDEVEKPGP